MNEMYEILFFFFFPRGVSIRWKCYFLFLFFIFIRVDGTFIVITL